MKTLLLLHKRLYKHKKEIVFICKCNKIICFVGSLKITIIIKSTLLGFTFTFLLPRYTHASKNTFNFENNSSTIHLLFHWIFKYISYSNFLFLHIYAQDTCKQKKYSNKNTSLMFMLLKCECNNQLFCSFRTPLWVCLHQVSSGDGCESLCWHSLRNLGMFEAHNSKFVRKSFFMCLFWELLH